MGDSGLGIWNLAFTKSSLIFIAAPVALLRLFTVGG